MTKLRKIGYRFGMECMERARDAKTMKNMQRVVSDASWELVPFADCFMKMMSMMCRSFTVSSKWPEGTIRVVVELKKRGLVKAEAEHLEEAILQLKAILKK